jgi:hypothetical protein
MALFLTLVAVAAAGSARPASRRSPRPQAPVARSEPPGLKPMSWRGLARLSAAGDGKVLSCTSEVTPGAEERFGVNICAAPPPEVVLKMRGGPGKAPVTVLLEVNMTVGGLLAVPVVSTSPGHKLTSLIKGEFEIAANGRVENCKMVERQGDLLGAADLCARVTTDRYAIGTSERTRATIIVATSLEDVAAQ